MGAVIPARKRVAVGQFLGQGGYQPEGFTPLNPPEKGRGGDDAPGSSGGVGNFFAEFPYTAENTYLPAPLDRPALTEVHQPT